MLKPGCTQYVLLRVIVVPQLEAKTDRDHQGRNINKETLAVVFIGLLTGAADSETRGARARSSSTCDSCALGACQARSVVQVGSDTQRISEPNDGEQRQN